MSPVQTLIPTNTWITATWDKYLAALHDPVHSNARSYYFNGRMKFEISLLGNPYGRDHATIIASLYLFAALRNIDLDAYNHCTYYKRGFDVAQPDASFYIGVNAEVIPWETTIVDLDQFRAPDLVIEVADSSADNQEEKRLLYESLGVQEYWIIDVQAVRLVAFKFQNRASYRIDQSQVLPGLDLAILEEALRRSRQTNHGKVSAWLLSQFRG